MKIADDRIGVTPDGTAAGGGFAGILVVNSTPTDKAINVTIGGAALRDRNIVADATTFGIYSAGAATFQFRSDTANAVAGDELLTMTATDAHTGNTSEFRRPGSR